MGEDELVDKRCIVKGRVVFLFVRLRRVAKLVKKRKGDKENLVLGSIENEKL